MINLNFWRANRWSQNRLRYVSQNSSSSHLRVFTPKLLDKFHVIRSSNKRIPWRARGKKWRRKRKKSVTIVRLFVHRSCYHEPCVALSVRIAFHNRLDNAIVRFIIVRHCQPSAGPPHRNCSNVHATQYAPWYSITISTYFVIVFVVNCRTANPFIVSLLDFIWQMASKRQSQQQILPHRYGRVKAITAIKKITWVLETNIITNRILFSHSTRKKM